MNPGMYVVRQKRSTAKKTMLIVESRTFTGPRARKDAEDWRDWVASQNTRDNVFIVEVGGQDVQPVAPETSVVPSLSDRTVMGTDVMIVTRLRPSVSRLLTTAIQRHREGTDTSMLRTMLIDMATHGPDIERVTVPRPRFRMRRKV